MTVVPASRPRPMAIVVLTALAAVLYAVGWLAGVVSVPIVWMVAALRVGWSDGYVRRERQ